MRPLLAVLASVIPAYLLGGVNGAIIASKLFYRKDIRKFGSGNPGLTNFYRVFGKGGALLVVAIDVFKTVAPVLFGGWIFKRYFDMELFGQAMSGFFVMLGHSFPIYYKFKGGKGVMAAGAVLIVLDWRVAIVSWGAFILVTALTRYVSLGAMIGAALFPPGLIIFDIGGTYELIAVTLCAMLLIVRHKANIKRLISGEESKFSFRSKK
jgi:glycerol-3-phosphate acyltransferase PlsY